MVIFFSVFHKVLFSLACWEIKFAPVVFKTHVTICILSSEVKYFSWNISAKENETNICLSMTAVLPMTRNISKDKSTYSSPPWHAQKANRKIFPKWILTNPGEILSPNNFKSFKFRFYLSFHVCMIHHCPRPLPLSYPPYDTCLVTSMAPPVPAWRSWGTERPTVSLCPLILQLSGAGRKVLQTLSIP